MIDSDIDIDYDNDEERLLLIVVTKNDTADCNRLRSIVLDLSASNLRKHTI
jgi:hypothetical protein